MSFLEKNLSILKQFDFSLYSKVQEWLKSENVTTKYKITGARNGDYTIKYNDGSKEVFIFSSYNPSLEGQKWAKSQEPSDYYIVLGLGLGYHLKELVDEDVKKIIVIEPEKEIFLLALKNINLDWLFDTDKFEIFVEEEKEIIIKYLRELIESGYGKVINYVVFNSYSKIYEEYNYNLEKKIGEIIGNSIMKVNTFKMFGKAWTNNFFENLLVAIKSPKVVELFDKFSDIPVVIISAGPSLSKNVHLLKELKGKALLLCVGTAYKALKKHNIKPDLILSFDGGIGNYRQFENIVIDDVPLVFDPVIYPQIIKEYQGPLITANVSSPFLNWIEEQMDITIGELVVGPSVANVTFDLARKVKGNPIIFIGQDLAYTDGRSHAEGTVYESRRHNYTGQIGEVFVEDINGNQICSERSWLAFLRWFEVEIKKTPGRIIIDATEGGAKISGTIIMTLREVIDEYCTQEHSIKEIISSFFDQYSPPDKKFYSKFIEKLDSLFEEVSLVHKESSQGLSLLEDLELVLKQTTPGQKEIEKILRKLNKIDENILSFQGGKAFLQVIFQPLVLPILNGKDSKPVPGETEKEAQHRIIRHSSNLYNALKDISKLVMEMIESSRKDFEQELNCTDKGGAEVC